MRATRAGALTAHRYNWDEPDQTKLDNIQMYTARVAAGLPLFEPRGEQADPSDEAPKRRGKR